MQMPKRIQKYAARVDEDLRDKAKGDDASDDSDMFGAGFPQPKKQSRGDQPPIAKKKSKKEESSDDADSDDDDDDDDDSDLCDDEDDDESDALSDSPSGPDVIA
jgi:hypothetical protein